MLESRRLIMAAQFRFEISALIFLYFTILRYVESPTSDWFNICCLCTEAVFRTKNVDARFHFPTSIFFSEDSHSFSAIEISQFYFKSFSIWSSFNDGDVIKSSLYLYSYAWSPVKKFLSPSLLPSRCICRLSCSNDGPHQQGRYCKRFGRCSFARLEPCSQNWVRFIAMFYLGLKRVSGL